MFNYCSPNSMLIRFVWQGVYVEFKEESWMLV